MEKEKKPQLPYISMGSNCDNGVLGICLKARDNEECIRFAYGLHASLLPVAHSIRVDDSKDNLICIFKVVK
nr:MAG: hypothetical protein [Microvirus sp.]